MPSEFTSYARCFGMARGLATLGVVWCWPGSRGRVVGVPVAGSARSLQVRLGTSDINVFVHIYRWGEYAWEFAESPRVIVDAGAYTGLSTAYFAMRYPAAKIIAIEPDEANFQLLLRNTAAFANVQAVRAALWVESGSVALADLRRPRARGQRGMAIPRPRATEAAGPHKTQRPARTGHATRDPGVAA